MKKLPPNYYIEQAGERARLLVVYRFDGRLLGSVRARPFGMRKARRIAWAEYLSRGRGVVVEHG